jgi:O-antigen ligase
VTAVVADFPRRARPQAVRASRDRLIETLAFGAAVLMLMIYSDGWELPLTGGGDETADSALLRAMYFPAYAAGIFLMALTPWTLLKGLVRQPFLLAILAVAAASYTWSAAPDQTLRRVVALSFTTLGGVVLAARYSWARLAEVVASCFAVLAVISLFVSLFVPSIGRMSDIFPGAWRGLWIEKNSFGGNMALGAVICAASAMMNPGRVRRWWSAAALCAGLLVMSTSKTALVAMILGGGALALVGLARQGAAGRVGATWVAVFAAGLIAAFAFFASDVLLGLLGKDATLTGRTLIWAGIMNRIAERPWFGYGYGAIWDNTALWSPLRWIIHDAGFRPHHAHNAWLEQWLSLGILGLSAWGGFFLQTLLANLVALYREKGAYLTLPFFVIYALLTLSESVAVQYNDMRWAVFIAFAVKLALPDPPPPRPSAEVISLRRA